MTFQVRVSKRAERDVDTIFDWLAARSKVGAVRWYDAYLTLLRALPVRAAGCATAPESEHLGVDLRQVFFKTRNGRSYRSLFMIDGNIIHVVGVRGPGQDNAGRHELELPE